MKTDTINRTDIGNEEIFVHRNRLRHKFGNFATKMVKEFNIQPVNFGVWRHGGDYFYTEEVERCIQNLKKHKNLGRMSQKRMSNKTQTERQQKAIKSFFK